jgi:hypothetical protein
MDADSDLKVACRPSLAGTGGVAFIAERLSQPRSTHWVLYVRSDQTAVEIHRVVPEPIGHALHPSGALGLLFPDRVNAVALHVAAGTARQQRWRFWLDDEPDVTDADHADPLGLQPRAAPMSA